jgi:hypothetical protein
MTETLASGTPWWAKPWFAPERLEQPILPGWSFGAVTVNAQNSSAPDTEREIVAAESYGRQIGKLLDAVACLIEGEGGPEGEPALEAVVALRRRVERIKRDAAVRRIDQFERDLRYLKTADRQAFETRIGALKAIIG